MDLEVNPCVGAEKAIRPRSIAKCYRRFPFAFIHLIPSPSPSIPLHPVYPPAPVDPTFLSICNNNSTTLLLAFLAIRVYQGMCHRILCNDCGKWTWEGCGLHIAEALAGLSLDQICSCDDDQDSEHSWPAIGSQSSKQRSTQYPIPYTPPKSTGVCLETVKPGASGAQHTACFDPSPVEYKLSKISATSATEAAIRKAKQAAALEELKKRKEQQETELKSANQDAVQRLLKGLSQATTDD